MEVENLKVLFVSSRGKMISRIPFIESQFESLKPYIKEIDHFRIGGSGIKAYIRSYKTLKQKLRQGNFDIIHAHWTYSCVLCTLLQKKEKIIVSFMGSDLQGIYYKNINLPTLKGLVNIFLSQIITFKVNGIIVKSKRMIRWIPPFLRFKANVIPNGVNLKKFNRIDKIYAREYLKLNDNEKYILFLGDPNDPRKNFSLVKQSLKLLDQEGIIYTLLAPYPIDSSKIPYFLASADVLAFPSKLEGSPNVIKEALAMECPIVATDVGDVVERVASIDGCYISKYKSTDFSEKLKIALQFNKRISSEEELKLISEDNIAMKIVEFYQKISKK